MVETTDNQEKVEADNVDFEEEDDIIPEWRFTQWFRKMPDENDESNKDYLSTVEFSQDGSFLATGDYGGRVVVLATDSSKKRDPLDPVADVHYKFHCEFSSHQPEFDYVRSQQVSEKINQIKWLPPANESLYMLVTNDKEIKLWKIYEDNTDDIQGWNLGGPPRSRLSRARFQDFNRNRNQQLARPAIKKLRLPKVEKAVLEEGEAPFIQHRERHKFARDVHQFPIASLAVSSDGEQFLSGDHLRVNLWNMNVPDASFNVVDIKPEDMQELNEVINVVDYHPFKSNLFLYGTSRANINLCDMRQRALCDTPVMCFGPGQATDGSEPSKGFFNELTQAVTDAKFSKGGRFIISRDYMSVKIWDINKENRPVETIYVHEYFRPSPAMWYLYEKELLFDAFTCGISADGNIVTGSYNNFFHIYHTKKPQSDTFIEASLPTATGVHSMEYSNHQRPVQTGAFHAINNNSGSKREKKLFGLPGFLNRGKKKKANLHRERSTDEYPYHFDFNGIDYDKKVLECAWHPEQNAVAVAGENNLFVYTLQYPQ